MKSPLEKWEIIMSRQLPVHNGWKSISSSFSDEPVWRKSALFHVSIQSKRGRWHVLFTINHENEYKTWHLRWWFIQFCVVFWVIWFCTQSFSDEINVLVMYSHYKSGTNYDSVFCLFYLSKYAKYLHADDA